MGKSAICFQCGQAVTDPPRRNMLANGAPCRACADRLLESIPPIFHSPVAAAVAPTALAEVLAEELRRGYDESPGGGKRA